MVIMLTNKIRHSSHKFSVTSGFQFTAPNGACSDKNFDCTFSETYLSFYLYLYQRTGKSSSCPGAFTNPTNGKLVQCNADNVSYIAVMITLLALTLKCW